MLTLKHGSLRFSARAQGEGPLVLCLHGFPDSLATFDDMLPALAQAGFRAIAVAMRGYEPTSQPTDGDYHALRMAEDAVAWIDQLGEDRAHLVGHDWGATIAFAAAALTPDKVATLTALAVPHPARFGEIVARDPHQLQRSHYVLEFQARDADAAILADNCAWLERLWRNWSPGWNIPDAALAGMRRCFAEPGVAHAALEWYRQAFDTASATAAATQALLAGPFAIPTLGLTGTEDGCISAEVFTQAMQQDDFPRGLHVERIAGAGHFLHRERPAAVNAAIIEWVQRHS